ncbi:ABC transporter permease [Streptomyces hoynatensis]|uniref:ABC transporter permease n=1 Tax=Streptomyces hoynatensis TaxID=1141874 RepID=A0A3A9YX53_9ACTN|nr:ABC transporter permease [Streptomyces hoynatensis]RKN39827.1 ABC transporter permease [Streptomyces hoynatensis]
MLRYLLRRLPVTALVLLLATVPIFAVLRMAPGDPAATLAGPDASPEAVAAIRHDLGLDRSLARQYLSWLGGALHGDFSTSFVNGAEVSGLVGRGLGNTGTLTLCALVLAVLLAFPLGVATALARTARLRTALSALNVVMLAVPTYVTGVLLTMVFSGALRLLPPGGYVPVLDDPVEGAQFLVLPSVCLALPSAAVLARFLAASLQRVFHEEHYFASRMRGLSRRRLILRHGLPNAVGPLVTVLGIQIGHLLGGAVIVEAIFAWPGLGEAMVSSANARDYPMVQAMLLLAVTVFIVLQLFSDLVYALVDPRVREQP